MTSFSLHKSVSIKAKPVAVWKCLTDPEIIKKYLFGTEALSDWKVGSELIFQGEYDGKKYRDIGVIQALKVNSQLKYSYFSSFSGLEEKPENFHLISYDLAESGDQTILTLTQENIHSEEARQHSDSSWEQVLTQIGQLAESL
jgi:uncharacterized protein YndB with AHSA1/START domain